ncbi:hypothetical protein SAMN03080618_01818 [Aquamicrobium aerolatum DSM 21857]|uniref:Uncharacterized protein n=1 Tax=Aquamicrobium aerolatum DSM 21857 TaxID=1121003 RepID=A0A1I3MP16_9HYPH|nr:hypothetical protein SAMN03080618_01818 [Aquamicrobium aerolatum DSM 21857]
MLSHLMMFEALSKPARGSDTIVQAVARNMAVSVLGVHPVTRLGFHRVY